MAAAARRKPRSGESSVSSAATSPHQPVAPRAGAGQHALVIAGLALLSLVVYAPVRSFPFINWDDPVYILNNPQVREGLGWRGLVWAFSLEGHAANWHPLTTLSHMLDVELFGLSAGGHHLVSVLLHLACTLALYGALTALTQAWGRSALVAALFAVHPMHVESVAWIAERKDVLSGLFFLLALWAYAGYARRKSAGRYLLVAFLYCLGLMSKPMVVTFPFVLLLLDVWPLGRLNADGATPPEADAAHPVFSRGSWGRGSWMKLPALVAEKIPLLVLTVVSSLITIEVQRKWGAVVESTSDNLPARLSNAATSYVAYLAKLIWPADMAAFYPRDPQPNALWVGACALLLAAMTVAAIRWGSSRREYLLVGWLWYLGMLFPVIGVVRVGDQAMADRYTYLPYVGLFMALVWLIGEQSARSKLMNHAATWVLSVMVLCALAVKARTQVMTWRSDEALWQNAASATRGNYVALNKLGNLALAGKRIDEAIQFYEEALRAEPNSAEAHLSLGAALADKQQWQQAIAHYREALRRKPNMQDAYGNMGNAYSGLGDYQEAARQFEKSLELNPNNADVRANYAVALMMHGRSAEAESQLSAALRLNPNKAGYHFLMAAAVQRNGRISEALQHLEATLQLDPAHAGALEAYQQLGGETRRQLQ